MRRFSLIFWGAAFLFASARAAQTISVSTEDELRTIAGKSTPETTIIRLEADVVLSSSITFSNFTNVTIEGFPATTSRNVSASNAYSGGLFKFDRTTYAALSNLYLNNVLDFSSAVVVNSSGLALSGVTFENAIALRADRGAALSAFHDSTVLVKEAHFYRNKAFHGTGGGMLIDNSTLVVEGVLNAEENIGSNGGFLALSNSILTILQRSQVRVRRNSAYVHGGAVSAIDSALSIEADGTQWLENSCGQNGAAFYLSTSRLLVTGNSTLYEGNFHVTAQVGLGTIYAEHFSTSPSQVFYSSFVRFFGASVYFLRNGFDTSTSVLTTGGMAIMGKGDRMSLHLKNGVIRENVCGYASSSGSVSAGFSAKLIVEGSTFADNTGNCYGTSLGGSGQVGLPETSVEIFDTTFSNDLNPRGMVVFTCVGCTGASQVKVVMSNVKMRYGWSPDSDSIFQGGCLNLVTKVSAYINNTLFEGCKGSFFGALYSSKSTLECEGCVFLRNNATKYGGAMVVLDGRLSLRNSIFIGNKQVATSWKFDLTGGGSISSRNSRINMNGVEFISSEVETTSQARKADGGALLLQNMVSVNITKTRFHNCSAGSRGGAIFLSGRKSVIDKCDFTSNTAGEQGGAIHLSE